ncbi:MAG: SurA N-terminal domain-containing protein [Nitrospirota bacterium]|nr:SurA N-terminal domain-containing protein [Nitrospirota bacterium]
MLQLMRQHIKFFGISLWLVIVAFIATIFVVWGMGDYEGGQQGGVEVAYVNGEPVSVVEYQRVYYNLYDFYRQVFKDKSADQLVKEMNLKQKALDDIISSRILLQSAKKMGARVTDEELRDVILSSNAFHENGVFSKERYRAILDANRLSPSQYEKYQRNELLQDKVREVIRGSVSVSADEVMRVYAEQLGGKPFVEEEFKKAEEKLRKDILAQKQEMAIASYIAAMKKGAEIKVVQDVLDKAA